MGPVTVAESEQFTAKREAFGASYAELVQIIIAYKFEIPLTELKASTRRGPTTGLARQVAMYLCHLLLGMTFAEVGALFGRDRTTASHACKIVEERREDRDFDEWLGSIEGALRALVALRGHHAHAVSTGGGH